MRPGVVGLLPRRPGAIAPENVARIRSLGFDGVSVAGFDPLVTERADLEHAARTLRDGGVAVAQANGTYPMLVHSDEAVRARAIDGVRALCVAGRVLGAATTYVRPGSLNPAGAWTPHPQNTALLTLERLADSLRRIVPVAESEGVTLALEGGAVSPIDSPERARDVVDAVGSRALRFNADPVNMVGTLEHAYNSTTLVNRTFDVLGDRIVAAHIKDFTVRSTLLVHLDEVPLGEGLMDQVTYLRRFEAGRPDGWMLVEHLPDELIPAAKRRLDELMVSAGLAWKR